MMLGIFGSTGRMYGRRTDLEGEWPRARRRARRSDCALPRGIFRAEADGWPRRRWRSPSRPRLRQAQRLLLLNDQIGVPGRRRPPPPDRAPDSGARRIRGLIPVRDAVRDCLRAQLDGSPDERVVETRQQLNIAYDRFVGRFGPVNGRANQRAFDGDPDLPLLLSLEHYNDETKVATKAAIFRERTIQHRQPVASAASPRRRCS